MSENPSSYPTVIKFRKEYLDEFDDEICFIPDTFPDFTQINGVEVYDYYKVNRWFSNQKRLLRCRFGQCCDCELFTPEILEQSCQHDPDTWNPETCHSSPTTKIEE